MDVIDLWLTKESLGIMLLIGREIFDSAERDFVWDIRMGLFIEVIVLTRHELVRRKDVVEAILDYKIDLQTYG